MSIVNNQFNSLKRLIIYLAAVLLIHACTDIKPDYEDPAVSVRYFHAKPSDGIAPRFEIGLHIINPNDFAMNIRGISYTIYIEGQRILLGVANDLPEIYAYDEGDIELQASTDVINSIKLIAGLVNEQREGISYKLDAKLDIKGFRHKVHVVRDGEVSFTSRK